MVLVILRYSFAPLAVCHLHSCFYLCHGNTTNRQHRDNLRAPLREQRNWVNSLTKAHGNLLIVDDGRVSENIYWSVDGGFHRFTVTFVVSVIIDFR